MAWPSPRPEPGVSGTNSTTKPQNHQNEPPPSSHAAHSATQRHTAPHSAAQRHTAPHPELTRFNTSNALSWSRCRLKQFPTQHHVSGSNRSVSTACCAKNDSLASCLRCHKVVE